ncbi:hypothetical protein ACFV07_10685 [Streptomyces anulatus]|uniref:hypothetical protein n=1 Tax=Streptomyces anulatus TaxID=1892 RepID=UPI003679EC4A
MESDVPSVLSEAVHQDVLHRLVLPAAAGNAAAQERPVVLVAGQLVVAGRDLRARPALGWMGAPVDDTLIPQFEPSLPDLVAAGRLFGLTDLVGAQMTCRSTGTSCRTGLSPG